jgi:uncharacterized protein with HEPN domain
MHPRSPKLLEDIRDAAAFIRAVPRGCGREQYGADRLLRQAVERNFEIIGEAVKQLAQYDPTTAALIGAHPQIIAFSQCAHSRLRPGGPRAGLECRRA